MGIGEGYMMYLLYVLLYQVLYSLLLAGIYMFVTFVVLKVQVRELKWFKNFMIYALLLIFVNLSEYIFPLFMYIFGEFSRIVFLLVISYFMGRWIRDKKDKPLGFLLALLITFLSYVIGYVLNEYFGFGSMLRL